MKLYLGVNCNQEYAEKPALACIEITSTLLARIYELDAVVKAHTLDSVSIDPPTELRWQGDRDTEGVADGLKIRGDKMVLESFGQVYWTAYDDYCSADFDTEWIALTAIRDAFTRGDDVLLGDGLDQATVDEYQEEFAT